MKKMIFMTVIALLSVSAVFAQGKKVTWTFKAKKIADKTYELHLTATVPAGYHLYSQFTGEGPIATNFTFTRNALVTLEGKVKEVGKLITVNDKIWNNKQKFFSNKVDFVQTVKLKSNVKTNISGEVESMICDDRSCQPPTKVKFNIALQ
jgi:Disulphide bond corrector protein DsbC